MAVRMWIPILLCVVASSIAFAEYDRDRIKNDINGEASLFGVTGWKKSENGEAWIASPSPKGMVLSAGKKNSGMIAVLSDSNQALQAMLRCMMLGDIGLAPKNESERGQVASVVERATQHQSSASTSLNGVTFEVSPQEVAGNVVLSCLLSPNGGHK